MDTSVTLISDTHCKHQQIDLPSGDLLIHCGDMFDLFSNTTSLSELDEWFGQQKFGCILCTGGNHDRVLEPVLAAQRQPFKNAYFLMDDIVEFRGLKIYGTPWVPDLPTHAFSKRGQALAAAWARIPSGIDVLVTHTPPKGILDTSSRGRSLGCQALANEMTRISPQVHCFGHVHASAGQHRIGETLFVNASSIESGMGRMRAPRTLSLKSRANRVE
jgi:Calcineurin-like phosphoesterase superfamily domain